MGQWFAKKARTAPTSSEHEEAGAAGTQRYYFSDDPRVFSIDYDSEVTAVQAQHNSMLRGPKETQDSPEDRVRRRARSILSECQNSPGKMWGRADWNGAIQDAPTDDVHCVPRLAAYFDERTISYLHPDYRTGVAMLIEELNNLDPSWYTALLYNGFPGWALRETQDPIHSRVCKINCVNG